MAVPITERGGVTEAQSIEPLVRQQFLDQIQRAYVQSGKNRRPIEGIAEHVVVPPLVNGLAEVFYVTALDRDRNHIMIQPAIVVLNASLSDRGLPMRVVPSENLESPQFDDESRVQLVLEIKSPFNSNPESVSLPILDITDPDQRFFDLGGDESKDSQIPIGKRSRRKEAGLLVIIQGSRREFVAVDLPVDWRDLSGFESQKFPEPVEEAVPAASPAAESGEVLEVSEAEVFPNGNGQVHQKPPVESLAEPLVEVVTYVATDGQRVEEIEEVHHNGTNGVAETVREHTNGEVMVQATREVEAGPSDINGQAQIPQKQGNPVERRDPKVRTCDGVIFPMAGFGLPTIAYATESERQRNRRMNEARAKRRAARNGKK